MSMQLRVPPVFTSSISGIKHFPNCENKRGVQEANVKRFSNSKTPSSLDSESWRNVIVEGDGAGVVKSLGREAQSKTVWKTLSWSVSQTNFAGVIVYVAIPRLQVKMDS